MDFKRAWHSLRYCCFFSSWKRAEYIKKHHIFGSVGEDVRLSAGLIPLRAEYIHLHNNIEIASGARLIPHDGIHTTFNKMEGNTVRFQEHIGKIEIFDNVFIGGNAIVLGPARIGPNVIVAAGAVVCGDVPPDSVVGGVPAKVICSYSELMKKREAEQKAAEIE